MAVLLLHNGLSLEAGSMFTILSLETSITRDSYVVLLLYNVAMLLEVGIIFTGYNVLSLSDDGISKDHCESLQDLCRARMGNL